MAGTAKILVQRPDGRMFKVNEEGLEPFKQRNPGTKVVEQGYQAVRTEGPATPGRADAAEVAALRAEVAELKAAMRGQGGARTADAEPERRSR